MRLRTRLFLISPQCRLQLTSTQMRARLSIGCMTVPRSDQCPDQVTVGRFCLDFERFSARRDMSSRTACGPGPRTRMPLYEYQCRACDQVFETLVRGGDAAACPSCQSHDIERLLSSFGVSSEARSHSTLAGRAPRLHAQHAIEKTESGTRRNRFAITCRRTTASGCPNPRTSHRSGSGIRDSGFGPDSVQRSCAGRRRRAWRRLSLLTSATCGSLPCRAAFRHVMNARLEAPALRRLDVGVLVIAFVVNLVGIAAEPDHQHVHAAGGAFCCRRDDVIRRTGASRPGESSRRSCSRASRRLRFRRAAHDPVPCCRPCRSLRARSSRPLRRGPRSRSRCSSRYRSRARTWRRAAGSRSSRAP